MHDLLREIGLSISEKEKFGVVYDGKLRLENANLIKLAACLFKQLKGIFNHMVLEPERDSSSRASKSVGKLRNLEMLNIRNTNIKELPSEAVELQNLRLLKMSSEWIGDIHNFEFATGVKVPFEISKLRKLQAVAHIKAEGEIVRQLGNMTQLNKMGIVNLKEADEQNILREDPLPHIAALPKLGQLVLVNSFVKEYLHFCNGFAMLKMLSLVNFPQLTGINIEKGIMPHIHELVIDSCLALNAVPQGLDSVEEWILRNLECLEPIVGGVEWRVIFAITCWFIWYRRNKLLFEGRDEGVKSIVATVGNYSINVGEAMKKDCVAVSLQVQKEVRWFR
ncbi:hypothetical protein GH714_014662 [Hevea brasiliensis]|uniref:Disease resistance R13L4/SHOC-2-like LRR domain-containing protein n=1 Tax=Hevea brasiliensis TaxID=3981 RepID=A0A6A6L6E0_HEVBR|nr:hypothetical protein GH714_014662 [Hevea brasiliensis]